MTHAIHPRRHPDAAYKLVDGEALIVLPGPEAAHHVLNAVGSRIWELLDGSRDIPTLCEQISQDFEVTRETAEQDLQEFLKSLADQGMLAEWGTR